LFTLTRHIVQHGKAPSEQEKEEDNVVEGKESHPIK
jgi:hypothetical protein